MDIEDIAEVAHETLRSYHNCLLSSSSEKTAPWSELPEEAKFAVMAEVEWRMEHVGDPVGARHEEWCLNKMADGWEHGYQFNAAQKKHPQIGPYEKVGYQTKVRDAIFVAVVDSLALMALRGSVATR